jgi:hypothetical protein
MTTAAKPVGIPVSERALIQRIKRRLKPDGMTLKQTRGVRARLDLGYFYVLDLTRNFALDTNVNIETYGRELGVLTDYETLIWDE